MITNREGGSEGLTGLSNSSAYQKSTNERNLVGLPIKFRGMKSLYVAPYPAIIEPRLLCL